MNCIENLPIYGAIVVTLTVAEVRSPLANGLSDQAASDLPGAMLKIVEAASSLELILGEAAALTQTVDAMRAAYETASLAAEIEALKVRLGSTITEKRAGEVYGVLIDFIERH
jgi:hypothetical protein